MPSLGPPGADRDVLMGLRVLEHGVEDDELSPLRLLVLEMPGAAAAALNHTAPPVRLARIVALRYFPGVKPDPELTGAADRRVLGHPKVHGTKCMLLIVPRREEQLIQYFALPAVGQ